MIEPFVWMEGLPPEVERRCRESISRTNAAVRAMDANPTCLVAKAAAQSARIEGERCKALLQEWQVNEEAAA